MLYDKTVTFDSNAGKLAHSGYLTRSDAIKESNKIYAYLQKRCREEGIKLSYDLSYDGFPRELIVTESFGGHGCLIIHPASDDFTIKLLKSCGKGERDWNFLTEKKDKYELFNMDLQVDTLVVLPGTNLLSLISPNTLKGMNKKGVYFKPHPITTEYYIRELEIMLGKDKILPKLASGAQLTKDARCIRVSRSTELGLYARLDGKEVKPYKINYRNKGSYFGLYEVIDRLPDVLSTARSGVIFPTDDYEAQIDEFLEYYRESLSNYSGKSRRRNKKKRK